MKLLADVNIAAATIRALRDRGFEVLALTEVGLRRLPGAIIIVDEDRTRVRRLPLTP